jgi:hypothetical protein
LRVKLGEDGIAGAGRGNQSHPGVGLHVGNAGLAQGRQLGQQRRANGRCHGQHLELTGLAEFGHRTGRQHRHLHVAAQ